VISGFCREVGKIPTLWVAMQRTTNLSHQQENGTDRLSLNVGKELPLYTSYPGRAHIS